MEDLRLEEWTPCEVHGHLFEEGRCRDCGEPRDVDEEETTVANGVADQTGVVVPFDKR